MNEHDLKALFAEQGKELEPKQERKRQAMEAALNEFDRASPQSTQNFFQGFLSLLRLRAKQARTPEEKTMRKVNQPWMLGGVATAVVGVFAFVLVNYQPNTVTYDESAVEEYALQLPSPNGEPALEEELVVTGVRQSIAEGIASKRRAKQESDLIRAEDIGSVSFAEKAESRSRVEGMKMAARPLLTEQEPFIQPDTTHRDSFEHTELNPIQRVSEQPVSTFSIDVDTASYSFVRRSLNSGRLPPKDSVRIEEMLNYFDYDYPLPTSKEQPFSTNVSVLDSPWSKGKKLIHIGIKGFEIQAAQQPRSNLVFLLDVSGSMSSDDKLPLVKQSLNMLLSRLQPEDTVAIVVYAGAGGTVLAPTPVKQKQTILDALNRLQAGGATAGAQGIELAYQLAESNFDKAAVNRIILATDGDFNVGITDREQLTGFIERKREKGIFLSVIGFGRGNYQDHLMQSLAQNGNGVAAYIDSLSEAQKVLVDEATSTLFPIAKDVKIQVEFNPNTVDEYRLIGYETRALKREDFNNDKVDAGDIGAGHTVTAIYEISPVGSAANSVDSLRYQKHSKSGGSTNEYAFLKVRYKLPEDTDSKLITTPIYAHNTEFSSESNIKQEVEFGIAVAGFAQLLKDDKYLSNWTYEHALMLAKKNKGQDEFGYRAEFVQLLRKAQVAKEM